MDKTPRKKLDPSLVRLALLVTFFLFAFIVAVVWASRVGVRDAHAPRPPSPPASTAPAP